MRVLQRIIDQAAPIGFLLMMLALSIYVVSCSIRQEIECPARPDAEKIKSKIINSIDEEFSK